MKERIETITCEEYKLAKGKMNDLFNRLETNISKSITIDSIQERDNIRKQIATLEQQYPPQTNIQIPVTEDLIREFKEKEEFYKQQNVLKEAKLIEKRQKRTLEEIRNSKVFQAEEMLFLVLDIQDKKSLWTSLFYRHSVHRGGYGASGYWSMIENSAAINKTNKMKDIISFEIGGFTDFYVEGEGNIIIDHDKKSISAVSWSLKYPDPPCGKVIKQLLEDAKTKEAASAFEGKNLQEYQIEIVPFFMECKKPVRYKNP